MEIELTRPVPLRLGGRERLLALGCVGPGAAQVGEGPQGPKGRSQEPWEEEGSHGKGSVGKGGI